MRCTGTGQWAHTTSHTAAPKPPRTLWFSQVTSAPVSRVRKPAQTNLATDNTNWHYNDSGYEGIDFTRHGSLRVNVLYVDSHVAAESKATLIPLWKIYQ